MLFYTGIMRTASDVARSYVAEIERAAPVAAHEGPGRGSDLASEDWRRHLELFGASAARILACQAKPQRQVSNADVDAIYERALRPEPGAASCWGPAAAVSCCCSSRRIDRPRSSSGSAAQLQVPFNFESLGSQIAFHESGVDYAVGRSATPSSGPVHGVSHVA